MVGPGPVVDTDDDVRLVQAALDDQPEAFAELFCRYQGRLVTSLVYLTGSLHLAEDLAQESFLKAFRHLKQFRQSSAFYSWLYRIALNELSTIRRRRQESPVVIHEHSTLRMIEPPDAVSDRLEREERVELLRAALQRLSEEHREIIVLREIDGCDYREIAEILGIQPGTVRSRLHRAREQLCQLLTSSGEVL